MSDADHFRAPAPLGGSFDPKWLIFGVATAAVLWLCVGPLVFLVWQSFMTSQSPTLRAVATLENYRKAYSNFEIVRLFGVSTVFAGGAAAFGLAIGVSLAWMNERTNTPFKPLFFALSIIPLTIPGVLFVVAWILLASPKIGILNLAVQNFFHTGAVPFNIYSLPGMMWVDGLHSSPIAFLLMTVAFRAMDPSLEDSALMSGASMFAIARRITMPLVWPAATASFLILFVRSLESFETPALLGLPVGIQVFTSAIYNALQGYPSDVGRASSYAVTLLIVTSAGIWGQSRIASQGSRYATVTGKGYRPRTLDLGPWRWLAGGLFLAYLALAIGLPFLVLLWSSLLRYYSVPSWAALKTISFSAYARVLHYPDVSGVIWNSAILAVGAATAVMIMSAVICWIVLRSRLPGRWILDGIASTPLVIPGLVLGLAIMICYLSLGGALYGTSWILLIAYMTRFLPYGMRYNSASLLQIHKELEESAEMSGASWSMAFWRIVLPLIKNGLIAGWIYIVIISIRELSSSILLYSPGSQVVSVLIWELWQNGQYVELSAFGVMLMATLFVFVLVAQVAGRQFGIKEA